MRDVKKRFGALEVLRGVGIELFAGEVLALLGDNGAGKSTLMKILAGTLAPDEGEIRLRGESVTYHHPGEARALGIEMVYQDLALCDSLDAAHNLFLGREPTRSIAGIRFVDRARMYAEARRALDDLNIVVRSLRTPIRFLSGGQRQSIAIGRAVSFRPKVLILDEPTAALAVREVEKVLALMQTLRSQGVSIVLITHRLQDVFRACDRIAILYEGTLCALRRVRETSLDEVVDLMMGAG
ncbi:MAG: sugar ABC transporter ATP-binding protein [Verrucomicrobia bacterium]|nr:sugar ABC transporter ATP-binding protein [Verrucomicrobiota bacterium]